MSTVEDTLREALDAEALRAIGVHGGVLEAIVIEPGEGAIDWAGLAHGEEIWLRKSWLEIPRQPDARRIRIVYLHEYAHTLTPGCVHNCIFWAVLLTLYRRAWPEGWNAGVTQLYDFQDDIDAFDLAYRLAWAIRFSKFYAPSELDGPGIAEQAKADFAEGKHEPHFYERAQLEKEFVERGKVMLLGLTEKLDREQKRSSGWERKAEKAEAATVLAMRRTKMWRFFSVSLSLGLAASLLLH